MELKRRKKNTISPKLTFPASKEWRRCLTKNKPPAALTGAQNGCHTFPSTPEEEDGWRRKRSRNRAAVVRKLSPFLFGMTKRSGLGWNHIVPTPAAFQLSQPATTAVTSGAAWWWMEADLKVARNPSPTDVERKKRRGKGKKRTAYLQERNQTLKYEQEIEKMSP